MPKVAALSCCWISKKQQRSALATRFKGELVGVKIQQLEHDQSDIKVLLVGLSCRNVRGFLFLWLNIFSFIRHSKKAAGALQVHAGISSPFFVFLVSYWESEASMVNFVKTPAHRKWMQFIVKQPASLHLYNETYDVPVKANFVGHPKGYTAAKQAAGEDTTAMTSYVRRTG